MASSPEEYWARRREITPSPQRLAVADGDRRLALVVNLSDDGILSRYRRLRESLEDFDCLLPTPVSELHLTIKTFDRVRGRDRAPTDVPDADASTGADGTVPSLQAVDQVVRDTLDAVDPFEVAFPRLNLFPDTVYAEVDSDGTLSTLNQGLCDREETHTSDRDAGQYVPHLTLGQFTGQTGYDRLVDFLEENRRPSFPTTTVSQLALVEREVTSDWQSGTSTLRTYSLSD